jgi:hypothetical protein
METRAKDLRRTDLTPQEAREKISLLQGYGDYWNHLKFNLEEISAREIRALLEEAAEACVLIKSALIDSHERRGVSDVKLNPGCAREYLYNLEQFPENREDFIWNIVKASFSNDDGKILLGSEDILINYLQTILWSDFGERDIWQLEEQIKETWQEADSMLLNAFHTIDTEELASTGMNRGLIKILNTINLLKEQVTQFQEGISSMGPWEEIEIREEEEEEPEEPEEQEFRGTRQRKHRPGERRGDRGQETEDEILRECLDEMKSQLPIELSNQLEEIYPGSQEVFPGLPLKLKADIKTCFLKLIQLTESGVVKFPKNLKDQVLQHYIQQTRERGLQPKFPEEAQEDPELILQREHLKEAEAQLQERREKRHAEIERHKEINDKEREIRSKNRMVRSRRLKDHDKSSEKMKFTPQKDALSQVMKGIKPQEVPPEELKEIKAHLKSEYPQLKELEATQQERK